MAIGKFPGKLTIPVKKSTDMKELTLQDLDDGVIVVLPDNSRYKVHRTNYTVDMSEWGAVLNKLQITLEGRPQPIIKQPKQQPKAGQPTQDNIMKKEFTKTDLRSGYLLQFENGIKGVVFCDYGYDGKSVICYLTGGYDYLSSIEADCTHRYYGKVVNVHAIHMCYILNDRNVDAVDLIWKREEKTPEQLAYEQLQAQIADEETRHNESMKALREQAERLKPKGSL